jgi:hypothetical protein
MTTIFIFLFKCFFVVFCLCPTMICHLFLKVPDAHISGKEEFFRKLDGLSCATNCKSFWGSAGRHELPTGDLVDFYTFERGRPNGGPNSICRKAAKFCPNCTATKSVPGTLQEGGASFRTTHWTLLLGAAQNGLTESTQEALSAFCEAYWPPLYGFLRPAVIPPQMPSISSRLCSPICSHKIR